MELGAGIKVCWVGEKTLEKKICVIHWRWEEREVTAVGMLQSCD